MIGNIQRVADEVVFWGFVGVVAIATAARLFLSQEARHVRPLQE